MNMKKFESFSARDQEELTKTLEEMQKLKPPARRLEDPDVCFDSYKFFLGRKKEFKVTRIK